MKTKASLGILIISLLLLSAACSKNTHRTTVATRLYHAPPMADSSLEAHTYVISLFGRSVECDDLPPQAVRRVLDYCRHLGPWNHPKPREYFESEHATDPEYPDKQMAWYNGVRRGALCMKPGSPYPTEDMECSAGRFCHNCLGEDAWVFFEICFRSRYGPLMKTAVNTAVWWRGTAPSLLPPDRNGYSGGLWSKCVRPLLDGLAQLPSEERARVWYALGMPRTNNTVLKSLDGLQKCSKLKWLNIENCKAVESVALLKGLPLTYLNIRDCKSIRDVSPLKGMWIKELLVEGSGVGKARHAPTLRKKPPSQPRRKESEGDKDVF